MRSFEWWRRICRNASARRRRDALFVCWVLMAPALFQYNYANAAQKTPMNEIIQSMKAVCFGRYLVNVPAKAEVVIGFAESDEIGIEPTGPLSLASSDSDFGEGLVEHEAELRALKHETEGVRLRGVSDLSGGRGKVFLYRSDATIHTMTVVEALIRRDSATWRLWCEPTDEDVPYIRRRIDEVAAAIEPRETSAIPTELGACINGGLLRRAPDEGERFLGGARIKELMWTLKIESMTCGPYEKHDQLLTRMAMAIKMVGKAASGTDVLRARDLVLDGRKGQEYVSLYSESGFITFSAHFELYGDATYKVPTLQLMMEAHRPVKRDPQDTRPLLSKEEALAVWDAVLKSIRPRPGAF